MSVIVERIGTMEYLAAESITVPHCFTTRFGGVSEGYLSSLNLGVHRGDDPKNVAKNYKILAQLLGIGCDDFVVTKQTHSDIVRVVDSSDRGKCLIEGASAECDALVTNTEGIALVVFTADCTPILLHDPATGAVGAAHAGWRGTAADIAGKTVRAMVANYGCDPQNIRAAIGPNIAQCCFQTDADVPHAMLAAFGKEAMPFIRKSGEKYYVNLKEMNALALRQAGVCQIEISAECTACQPDRFWSHRRVGNQRGSQGAVIVCRR